MIRFRNPGTQYTTQVQVFRELYKEYKDAPSFDLDDMAATIAKTKLMTAYGLPTLVNMQLWQMMCYHYMSSAYWESTIPKK